MTKELEFAKELIDFIYESPTAFHAVENVKNTLEQNGFKQLKEEEKWKLEKGKKYFMIKNHSALIAFTVGNEKIEENGFRIIGAHTDSPSFRVKPNPEMTSENSYIKLNTEVYGGPILNTWFDRPLSLAGRVIIKGKNILNPKVKLLNIKKPVMIIPNLAIHMNRKVNEGIELNKQVDTLPILGLINEKFEKDNYLAKVIADELKVDYKDILDFDLFLYEYEKGSIIGINNEFISSSRLDDLEAVHGGVHALINAENPVSTNVLVCFDNEEVGSATKQGADSEMLSNVLERIVLSLDGNRDDFFRVLAKSFMISADAAHAVHPNKGQKSDPTNRPFINKGPAVKIAASQSYTSDSYSTSIFVSLCEKAGVPVQKFVNRSDERGGSTIGPISSTHINIPSVDIGTPMLAMHSIRELCGVMDHYYVARVFKKFYELH
ncbi:MULTISPECIES: M18 family aminopeptidase [Clostridium]|jgi:aspartyl aminopeptidase|uniref:Probable M18 family aminopeptidase 2 n=2 Tax=Clostridium TaxID=1485 RepID=A0A151ANF2_9CLOT|nr:MULTISPECIES: M18 family aminopeptidase [Clostridium]KYH29153.1 putative M18 family aminopeptidase 2 [Clostridium colicanis DSM 13634]MBE6043737.1 M18 family aminopeptidase [Clostridium thermopalmarium]PRR73794.1 putative M18 family aminopeptidase 2 [Clostridium thermopalmarium DSM 5974]PVZ21173.1 aspartyl aminopeptidase [Clostridium thermopalmarium DSM 5974]